MKKLTLIALVAILTSLCMQSNAQMIPKKFGKGINILGVDSTFYLKLGFRFQNLYTAEWDIIDDKLENYEGAFLVRRSRLKFDGWAFTTKLKYKLELSLSNRDLSGGNTALYRNAPNLVLDAKVDWNFYKTLTIRFGQGKLPGNRERLISSGNLQFVDRSRLNSRFTTDRDMGVMLINKHKIGEGDFIAKETISLHSGEGRNITEGNIGGYATAFKIEVWPYGNFTSKGDYIGSAVKYEANPKLAIALSYEINDNAVRERGQLGDFIVNSNGDFVGKTLNTFFADLMYKYKNWSLMGEYANKQTDDDISIVYDDVDDTPIGTFYTGNAVNLQLGYMFDNNWELAFRYTDINPDENVASPENYYTVGINKFVVGHKLKVQTDFSLVEKNGSSSGFLWRTQMDIHF